MIMNRRGGRTPRLAIGYVNAASEAIDIALLRSYAFHTHFASGAGDECIYRRHEIHAQSEPIVVLADKLRRYLPPFYFISHVEYEENASAAYGLREYHMRPHHSRPDICRRIAVFLIMLSPSMHIRHY